MQPEGVNSIPVVIDLMSLGLMKGTVDGIHLDRSRRLTTGQVQH